MNRDLDKIQVVGLGQACVDYLGRIPSYPKEDDKAELMDLHIQCGGPASTALVTLSRLGIPTSFMGSISDDSFGLEILKGLKEEKVDTTFLKITPGYTSQFAFIAITEASGNRNIFWRRGSAPFLKPGDVDLGPFQKADILHLDNLMTDSATEAARQAKDMGIKVVLDGGTMRKGSRELISLVDVLIASEGFAKPLTGLGDSPEASLKALSQFCPGDVIITLGSKGSVGYCNGNMVKQKAFPVKAVDTTGAGDVYHGAYIYGLLQGWDMLECMRFASATSAMKCREIGARKGIPRLEEIKKFMG
ncbi:MAG: sugar kinase [Deltaproteobacteria bacterium]|nr:sugar kinase [Deltaproteobacteria bacterium]